MTRKRRNTTYKDWITEDGLIKLEGMARDGIKIPYSEVEKND